MEKSRDSSSPCSIIFIRTTIPGPNKMDAKPVYFHPTSVLRQQNLAYIRKAGCISVSFTKHIRFTSFYWMCSCFFTVSHPVDIFLPGTQFMSQKTQFISYFRTISPATPAPLTIALTSASAAFFRIARAVPLTI